MTFSAVINVAYSVYIITNQPLAALAVVNGLLAIGLFIRSKD